MRGLPQLIPVELDDPRNAQSVPHMEFFVRISRGRHPECSDHHPAAGFIIEYPGGIKIKTGVELHEVTMGHHTIIKIDRADHIPRLEIIPEAVTVPVDTLGTEHKHVPAVQREMARVFPKPSKFIESGVQVAYMAECGCFICTKDCDASLAVPCFCAD